MRVSAFVVVVATLGCAVPARTASAQEKAVVKWEYAELSFRGFPGRPAGKDNDGNEVPASQGTLTVRWTTGADDLSIKGWDELAEKLKVTLKKGSSPASQKLQVLNGLGAVGWELVDLQTASPTTPTGGGFGNPGGRGGFGQPGGRGLPTTNMLFKRRVP